jgi:hypothetical protein
MLVDFFNRRRARSHGTDMTRLQCGLVLLLVSPASCGDGPANPLGRVTILGEAVVDLACAADSGGANWSCPDRLRVDCAAPEPTILEVVSPDGQLCEVDALVLTPDEPLRLGTHALTVRDQDDDVLCTSELVVERSTALQLLPKALTLWPPNHKFHEIDVADCVEIVGACPGETPRARFTWVSSDEPVDAQGDGHHEPDVALTAGCQQVALRAERQGTRDGRVYTLGVRVLDGLGESHESTCTVSVTHDQSGRPAQASAEVYRIELDGSAAGFPDCTDSNLL